MRLALAVVAILAAVGVAAGVAAAGVVGGLIASVEVPAADPPAPRASKGPEAAALPGGGSTSTTTNSPRGPVAGGPVEQPFGGLSSSPSLPPAETTGAVLTLTGPTAAPAGGRVDLTGRYEGAPSGTVLQVQRRVEGEEWADFPVQVSTGEDGQFSTWIVTSRTGRQQFRVVDLATGLASPPIDVTISSSSAP